MNLLKVDIIILRKISYSILYPSGWYFNSSIMIEERVIKVNVNNILGNEFLKPFLETKMGYILSFNIIITTLIAVQ